MEQGLRPGLFLGSRLLSLAWPRTLAAVAASKSLSCQMTGRGGGEYEPELAKDSGRGGRVRRRRPSRHPLKERLLDTLFSSVEGDACAADIVVPGQDAASLLKLGLAWDDLLPIPPEGALEEHWLVYSTLVEAQKPVTDRASWQRWQGRVRAWVKRNLKDHDCGALVENLGAAWRSGWSPAWGPGGGGRSSAA